MNATSFTKKELSLIRYACQELAFRRSEQATAGTHSEWAEANRKEAKAYYAIASKIGEHLKSPVDRIPSRESGV